MISTIHKTIRVTLVLEKEEAEWLKRIVQNPIDSNESMTVSKYRKTLWLALGGKTSLSESTGLY